MIFSFFLLDFFKFLIHFSFENSPRHAAYVPRFEADLAQFCEKLVSKMSLDVLLSVFMVIIFTYICLSYSTFIAGYGFG